MVTQLLTKHSDIVFAAVVGGGGGTNLTVTRGDAGDSAGAPKKVPPAAT